MKNINDNGKRRKIKITAEPAKAAHMRGDGNCLFRALSFNLFGVQSYHKSVRETLYSLLHERESNLFAKVENTPTPFRNSIFQILK